MSALLKKKSKIGVERTDRIKYDSYNFGPRMNMGSTNMANSQY